MQPLLLFIALLIAISLRVTVGSREGNHSRRRRQQQQDLASCEWKQIGSTLQGSISLDQFGKSVALNGDGSVLAVSAVELDAGGRPGYVRVFATIEDGDTFQQLGNDIVGSGANDRFGQSISLSLDGRTLAVGALWNDGNGEHSGHVRVFEYNSDLEEWTQLGQDLNGEREGDEAGASVALNANGDIVAVGAALNDGADGADSGHVRVFELSANRERWIQLGPDIEGQSADSYFGRSVALSADGFTLVSGANRNDLVGKDAGQVRVFRYDRESDEWSLLGSSISGRAVGDQFGKSVSISADGSTIAAGADQYDFNGSDVGQVRAFSLSEDDVQWTQLGQDIVGEDPEDLVGESVSLSADGRTLAVGAAGGLTSNGIDAGRARVLTFSASNNNWIQVGADIDGETSRDDFGYSVSLSRDGKSLAVGARYNNANGSNSGQAKVYRTDPGCLYISETIAPSTPEPTLGPSGTAPTMSEDNPSGISKQFQFKGIELDFLGATKLSLGEMNAFESVTEKWYSDFYQSSGSSLGVLNFVTLVSVRNQTTTGLDQTASTTLVYDQTIEYTLTGSSTLTSREVISQPFLDSVKRDELIESLKIEIDAFKDVQSLNARPQIPPGQGNEASQDNKSTASTGVIAGAIAAGAVFAIGGVAFVLALRRRHSRRGNNTEQRQRETSMDSMEGQPETVEAIAIQDDPPTPKPRVPSYKDQVRGPSEGVPIVPAALAGPRFKDQVRSAEGERPQT